VVKLARRLALWEERSIFVQIGGPFTWSFAMSGDQELTVMGTVLSAMEPLTAEERKRVFIWLAQKLDIELSTSRLSPSLPHTHAAGSASELDLSTDTIATVLGAKSGPDLIIAAAANLHFVQGKQRFSRQQLTAEMRTAPAHFKETFLNNLSKYLTGLTKGDRLRLVASDTYAISSKERQELEAHLVSAA
jgi:hypothetical protein